jgi:hypothetical protein
MDALCGLYSGGGSPPRDPKRDDVWSTVQVTCQDLIDFSMLSTDLCGFYTLKVPDRAPKHHKYFPPRAISAKHHHRRLGLVLSPLLLTARWFGHPGSRREADGGDADGMHRQGTDGCGGGRGLEGWDRCMVYR